MFHQAINREAAVLVIVIAGLAALIGVPLFAAELLRGMRFLSWRMQTFLHQYSRSVLLGKVDECCEKRKRKPDVLK
jgi:hypothetical protein